MHPEPLRKIIHIDMDAFYASVEQRDFPELRGKPIAVGGGGRRGVTTTASYEARKFGVKSAMPGFKARKLCPHIIFVKPRFEAYKEVSLQIREIFKEYTDLIEPLSLDEAFLDVTENKKGIPYGQEVAQEIMDQILAKTKLTCSAGVSYCKFLAKVASDIKKPNGLTIIRPERAEKFLEELPIRKFFGIGKVTAEKMKNHGIEKGKDLKAFTRIELATRYGKMGSYYYDIVRGVDNRPVRNDHVRKSIGIETTLIENIQGVEELKPLLDELVERFYARLTKAENFGRTITLKLKTGDFKIITRSNSKDYFVRDIDEIRNTAMDLLTKNIDGNIEIRLIGITASNLEQERLADDIQLVLDLK